MSQRKLTPRKSQSHMSLAGLFLLAALLLATLLGLTWLSSGDPARFLATALDRLGPWTYVMFLAFGVLETAAFVAVAAPGATGVIVLGALAGLGRAQLAPVVLLVWAGAALGEGLSYGLGRRLARDRTSGESPRFGLTPERRARVESLLERHGAKAILVGRFIAGVSAVGPFLAGATRLPSRRFFPASAVATGLWSLLWGGIGYAFANSLETLLGVVSQASGWIAAGGVVVLGIAWAARRLVVSRRASRGGRHGLTGAGGRRPNCS